MDDVISINTYSVNEYISLPLNGWLKPCTNIKCRDITSLFTIYKYRDMNFKFYFCYKCLDNINTEEYIENFYYLVMLKKYKLYKS